MHQVDRTEELSNVSPSPPPPPPPTLFVDFKSKGTAKINQANVILGDIPATNGVMHIIDSVLIPEPYASNIVVG